MRSFCQYSRRWHQQFYLSLARAGHHDCIARPLGARSYRQRGRSQASEPKPASSAQPRRVVQIDAPLKVREFEQVGPSQNDVKEIDPKGEITEESKDVAAEIQRLENELAVLKEGPFGPNSEFMQSLSPDDRAKALKALEDEGLADNEDWLDEELDQLTEEREPVAGLKAVSGAPKVMLKIPRQQQAYVQRFNKAVEAMYGNCTDTTHSIELWKWYLRCQQHVPGFSDIVPEDVWHLLWKSQGEFSAAEKRVIMLAKDMLSAGVSLTAVEWISYIESLITENDIASATSLWQSKRSELGPNAAVATAFWTLGVRLYCELGRPQKAEEVAFECLDHGSFADPLVLITVMLAWARSQHSDASQKAWSCYLRLRSELGDKMTAEIYDTISFNLLQAGRPDMGLAVFKDMYLPQDSSQHSDQVFYDALKRLSNVQNNSVTVENINQVSLAALLVLPKSILNKYFFGAWIERLLGAGHLDTAASVVELMYERNIRPDVSHLNGIIRAWLRRGSAKAQAKAEDMAWSMISQRINFVRKRSGSNEPLPGPVLDQSGRRFLPLFIKRPVPSATRETFSVLLNHYISTDQEEVANQVTELMTDVAEIPPNAFIMNQWLQLALKKGEVQHVWDRYITWSSKVRPDFMTFAHLWDTGKIQYDRTRAVHAKDFPSARVLYREMSQWLSKLSSRDMKALQEEISHGYPQQIIRCFCLSADLPGVFCALHGIKHAFNVYPKDGTARLIVMQVSQLLRPKTAISNRRRQRRVLPQTDKTLAKVGDILNTILEEKKVTLLEAGIDPEKISVGEMKKLQLEAISDFILVTMKRLQPASGETENNIRTVAKVMGVDISSLPVAAFESIESPLGT